MTSPSMPNTLPVGSGMGALLSRLPFCSLNQATSATKLFGSNLQGQVTVLAVGDLGWIINWIRNESAFIAQSQLPGGHLSISYHP